MNSEKSQITQLLQPQIEHCYVLDTFCTLMVGEVIIKVKYKVCLEILKTQIFTTEKYGLLTSVYLGLQNDKNIT